MPSPVETLLCRSLPYFIENFFSFWPIVDIVRFCSTSFKLSLLFKSYRRIMWDPTAFFARWFSKPFAFRRLLGLCNAVVSGSQALQFFDRTEYSDSDLDIFLPSPGVLSMAEWLRDMGYDLPVEEDGYDFLDRVVDASSDCEKPSFLPNHMRAVFTFSRQQCAPDGTLFFRRVQLIVVDMDPVEFILFDFHSTAVMNFITYNKAVCVFPLTTLHSRASYLCRERYEDPVRTCRWVGKYASRGFRVITGNSSPVLDFSHIRFGRRKLNDVRSWVMSFSDVELGVTMYVPSTFDVTFDVGPLYGQRLTYGASVYIRPAL